MASRKAVAAGTATVDPSRSVFVNCPFDDEYLPLLHALLFTIHDCGFVARLAVEDAGASEMRIEKIVRLIRESQYSIHDISRVEMSGPSNLPRFNMPFEAGLAFAATRFDPSMKRDLLVLEAQPFRDKQTLSDLAGTDTKPHGNQPENVVAAVRGFLALKAGASRKTRGADAIWKRYQAFRDALPTVAAALEISLAEISSFDYLADWLNIAGEWVVSEKA